MRQATPTKTQVYYDGLCPICVREINHYRKIDDQSKIGFVDISNPGFVAEKEGLDPEGIQKRFHVKKANGEILDGVPAFVEIWKVLDIFRPLQWAATSSVFKPIFEVGYVGFTKIRPYFRNEPCENNYCATTAPNLKE